jgi:hypothetical protein
LLPSSLAETPPPPSRRTNVRRHQHTTTIQLSPKPTIKHTKPCCHGSRIVPAAVLTKCPIQPDPRPSKAHQRSAVTAHLPHQAPWGQGGPLQLLAATALGCGHTATQNLAHDKQSGKLSYKGEANHRYSPDAPSPCCPVCPTPLQGAKTLRPSSTPPPSSSRPNQLDHTETMQHTRKDR